MNGAFNLLIFVLVLVGLMVILFLRIYFDRDRRMNRLFMKGYYPRRPLGFRSKPLHLDYSINPSNRLEEHRTWQGRRAYNLGRFDEATDLFTQEIASPTDSKSLISTLDHRARVYRAVGRASDAVSDYSEAMRLLKEGGKPAEGRSIYYYAGCASLAAGDSQTALGIFNIFIENLWQTRDGHLIYSTEPKGASRDYQLALDTLNQAITAQPNERVLYYCRALAECALYEWEAALADCDRGLQLSADNSTKDRLAEAFQAQKSDMKRQETLAEDNVLRISKIDLDKMMPDEEYAQVSGNQVVIYSLEGNGDPQTADNKEDIDICRQLIADGWEHSMTGGTASAESTAIYYFRRPKQGISTGS
jgi:tetratricopeptide (TPR) repeat protein